MTRHVPKQRPARGAIDPAAIRCRYRCLVAATVLLFIGAARTSPAASPAGEITAGIAATRGYFDWAATGGWAPLLFEASRSIQSIDFPMRLEAVFATRENVTNLVGSVLPTLRWHVPGFEGNDFAPYIATGPGLHLQGTWSSLRQFGGVELQTATVLKWHAFVGASLARGERAQLVVESRYTVPSDIAFDYVALAVRIRTGWHP
ncbi:MAG: hypothetical protein PVF43_09690 [Candidatus Eiseniibacteriota bacterium]|jgi:hypothetical protein